MPRLTLCGGADEQARHPKYQRRLQAEVDAFFEKLAREGREMVYDDCKELPFMTKWYVMTSLSLSLSLTTAARSTPAMGRG